MSGLTVWLDLETTGLNPNVEEIAEVGVVVTDGLWDEVGRARWVLSNNALVKAMENADPSVKEMHEKSGLAEDVRFMFENGVTATPISVAAKVITYLKNLGVTQGSSPMCGSTIQFDRLFLEFHAPELAGFFHYRNLDISSIKEFVRRGNLGELWKPSKDKLHRTLEDLDSTMEEARFYFERYFAHAC